tara:strand:+ start:375 stop:2039 length:1665 start_codon:yes stop_codon:yes gene_type:complete
MNDSILQTSNFIKDIIEKDKTNNHDLTIMTRFPPEPNGYLHIGHAKSAYINFSLAKENSGTCNLRFDDTNPTKENQIFVNSIKDDLAWLGFKWEKPTRYASDYFDKLYDFAKTLIFSGDAYVCDLTPEEIRTFRGTLTKPGTDSPYRNREVSENIELFEQMKNGCSDEGARVLRAKIDMSSGNLNLRDPVIYRIIKTPEHHRTKNEWHIYPTYDFAHGQADSIEGVTHSICTLEFEDHKPLYDWLLEKLKIHHPQQIEFARLNLSFTVLSKRKLANLVSEKYVTGWDDPRMPTLAALRRRGYPPTAILNFCTEIGVAKRENTIDISLLEHHVRKELNQTASRILGVIDPVKLIIDNYPENTTETFEAINNPENPKAGIRKIPFSRELFIEKSDFMENPTGKFFRLTIGSEVRLKYAYIIKCTNVIKDPKSGEIVEIHCTYDPLSKGGVATDGRKIKGTLHWVSASDSITAEIKIYDRLFTIEKPETETDYLKYFNNDSLITKTAQLEPSIISTKEGSNYQFERIGYFILEKGYSSKNIPVFNQTVSLRDSRKKT